MSDVNVKKCSSCGEALQPDAAFCSNCGQCLTREDASVRKCSSCGEAVEPNAAFCTSCGTRFEEKKAPSAGEQSPIGKQMMALANDFLSVREASPDRFEFSSQTGVQSPVQKIKIKYEAVAQLNPESKQVTFWEKMVESSAGMNTGFSVEKKVQKGIEVGKKIDGQILFGGKYGFEYGKLREVVKAIAVEQGWEFKTVIFKPKKKVDSADKGPEKSLPFKKFLVPALALLLMVVIGAIGYKFLAGRSTSSLMQTNANDGDSQSLERKEFQEKGSVNEGKSLIETDKNIYNYGEKIMVHFYNAPGYSRDWICIVRAGSRNTEAGNYQYIPRGGRGVLIFRSPRPGKYEARAYYNYSPGQYNVTARYGFTVVNRPAN